MVGVDTQVVHGYVRCGARGAITGVGNALPLPVLRLIELCVEAAKGNVQAYRHAAELDQALGVLSKFDEGTDLVLYYKHLMVLAGNPEYTRHINAEDRLSPTQKAFVEDAWNRFQTWWKEWPARKA
jgi:4-hydroxy-tetrahydrodipicolinate synthase